MVDKCRLHSSDRDPPTFPSRRSLPYTVLHMEPRVNVKLLDMGDKAEKGMRATELGTSEREIKEQFMRWKGMNFVRAAIVGAGALLSAVATLA